MKYKIERTNKFIKQYSKIYKQKEFKEENFIEVLKFLTEGLVLPAKYNNHLLTSKSKQHMGMSCST